jgi:site-specific DNA-adenine methylase
VPEAGVNEWEPTTIIHNDPPYDPATATGRAAAHTAEYMPVRRVQLLAAASTHAKARRR